MFGGACQRCGYCRSERALHFHHTDGSAKRDWSGDRGMASVAEIRAHPERFLLLCANCHIEEHESLDAERREYRPCRYCGKPVVIEPFRALTKRDKFCSRECRHAQRRLDAPATVRNRFWKYVSKTETCWLWTGTTVRGYPVLQCLNSNGNWAPRGAARISYVLHGGEIAQGANLGHTCGVVKCVRPEHLYLLT